MAACQVQAMQQLLDGFVSYTPTSEQELDLRVAELRQVLAKYQDSGDGLVRQTARHFQQVLGSQAVRKRQLFAADRKRLQGNLSVVQLIEQINRAMSEEDRRAQDILEGLRRSTDTLRAVGLTQQQINKAVGTGGALVSDVRQHEARDQLVVGALFGLFVATSVCVVARRVYRLVSLLL